ncbi:MAG TPA: MFS transporter [Gaiellaceae bacterium]
MRGVGRFGPLKEPQFRLLWFARTGSVVGDSLVPVAVIWAVGRELGESATGVGLVLACYTFGGAAVTLAGGVWADRLPRRAVMICADLVRVGTQATTAVLLFGGAAHVWELAVLQGTAGAAAGFFNPASKALIPQTVSSGRLQQANALVSLSRSTANVFGPALSGVIVAVAGAAWVFSIDAASFLVSAVFVAAIRVGPYAKPAAQRFSRELAEGWQEVRRHRWLTAGFLGYAVGNFGVGVYIVVGSLVAIDHLGGAPAWGLIVGSAAFGGVLGGLIAYRIRPSHPVSMAFAIWTLCALPAFALARPFPLPVVMACALLFGGSVLVGNTLFETAMQQEVEPRRLARVASIDLMLSLCLMPAGQLLAGTISNAVGVDAALVLAGTLMCVPNFLVLVLVPEVRSVERREEQEAEPEREPALLPL